MENLEAKNPQLYMLLQLLSNRETLSRIARGVKGSGFLKHRGVFSGLLETRAEENPNRIGLIIDNGGLYPDDHLTYARMAGNSFRLARGLQGAGLEKGDKVAMVMRNHPDFVYALAACSMLGMVLVPIDPRARGEKLTYQLGDSDAKVVITTADLLPEVEKAVKEVANLDKVYLSMKPDADPALASKYPTINELLERAEVYGIDDRQDNPGLPVQIIYTSGVTGNPKGVTLNSARNAMYCLWVIWYGTTAETISSIPASPWPTAMPRR
jgi:crotonobetaine/carnitine-CoA ligase